MRIVITPQVHMLQVIPEEKAVLAPNIRRPTTKKVVARRDYLWRPSLRNSIHFQTHRDGGLLRSGHFDSLFSFVDSLKALDMRRI